MSNEETPQGAAPAMVQQIKAPNDSNGAMRVLWLVMAAEPKPKHLQRGNNRRAEILDIVIGMALPAKYGELLRLPTIMTHMAGYSAWVTYKEQMLGDESDEPQP